MRELAPTIMEMATRLMNDLQLNKGFLDCGRRCAPGLVTVRLIVAQGLGATCYA
jgi:hypothetical protein